MALGATGTVFGKPMWYVLGEHVWADRVADGELVPFQGSIGRRTDVNDATWIAQLLECDLRTSARSSSTSTTGAHHDCSQPARALRWGAPRHRALTANSDPTTSPAATTPTVAGRPTRRSSPTPRLPRRHHLSSLRPPRQPAQSNCTPPRCEDTTSGPVPRSEVASQPPEFQRCNLNLWELMSCLLPGNSQPCPPLS